MPVVGDSLASAILTCDEGARKVIKSKNLLMVEKISKLILLKHTKYTIVGGKHTHSCRFYKENAFTIPQLKY